MMGGLRTVSLRSLKIGRLYLPRQAGSILLLVLFMCLGVAVVIQALSAVVLCAENEAVDEMVGRLRLEEKDQGLATLRQRCLTTWEVLPWTPVWQGAEAADSWKGSGKPAAVQGALSEVEGDVGWVFRAAARQDPSVSRLVTSAWVERGRDGIDLPLAALVAGTFTAGADRGIPWMECELPPGSESGSTATLAVGYVLTVPETPRLGEGCSLSELPRPWRLDPGWAVLQSRETIESQTARRTGDGGDSDLEAGPLPAVAPGPSVALLSGRPGRVLEMPAEIGHGARDSPILAVVTGGADLDARDLGDIYGVIVVDDGSLLLEGTTVHGAVFVTEEVDLGGTGQLRFSRTILRWATDRSLCRARLVPGSRWEGME